MIKELFGGAGLLGGGERKFSFHGGILEGLPSSSSPSPSLSPSPSPSHPTTATSNTTSASASATSTTNSAAINTSTSSDQQNLRCPRCDSPNTKFCYYNNYNLTQPRHFCKTCRRYWTKGGALRNVPIGGGCRKNKNIITTVPTIAGKSSVAGKVKSSDFKSNLGNGFDHHHHQQQSSNPILWPSQHNPHQLLALLGASSQNPNPNCVKNEGGMIGSHMGSEAAVVTSALNTRNLNIDHHLGQVPIGLCSSTTSSAFWRNNNNQHHQNGLLFQSQVQQQNSNGMQDLYQRLRSSSAANYYSSINDHTQQAGHVMNNAVSTSSASLSILDSAPVAGGEMGGYWNNPQFSWTDLSGTTNGAFP